MSSPVRPAAAPRVAPHAPARVAGERAGTYVATVNRSVLNKLAALAKGDGKIELRLHEGSLLAFAAESSHHSKASARVWKVDSEEYQNSVRDAPRWNENNAARCKDEKKPVAMEDSVCTCRWLARYRLCVLTALA